MWWLHITQPASTPRFDIGQSYNSQERLPAVTGTKSVIDFRMQWSMIHSFSILSDRSNCVCFPFSCCLPILLQQDRYTTVANIVHEPSEIVALKYQSNRTARVPRIHVQVFHSRLAHSKQRGQMRPVSSRIGQCMEILSASKRRLGQLLNKSLL